ncbi:MAG: translation initiation factor IF-1 [Verrucomicrobiota bacterium]
MSRTDAIKVEGTVIEALRNNLFWVVLSNGHRVMAHVSKRARTQAVPFASGDKVYLEMSPYDLSKGRIILAEK